MKNIQSIKPPTRFLRSTHLERDFYDSRSLDSYVLTDMAIDSIRRISGGLRSDSSERCWRIIGDYGSGKSSFALLLAHWFAGNTKRFPRALQGCLSYSTLKVSNPKLIPILVTGSRESLGITIQRGIQDALNQAYPAGLKKGFSKIKPLLIVESISDNDVLNLLSLVSKRIVADQKGRGLLLIIDELGKILEHTASSLGEGDVFLMQRLAEISSRSGDTPFFIVGILHQGFSAYASSLGVAAKAEWDKVASRYYEIVFQHPMEQTAALVAEALGVPEDALSKKASSATKKAMGEAVSLGWYGAAASAAVLKGFAHRLTPLDPFVVPVMSRVLTRFGQNQRSIFSFLFGTEPHALQAFLVDSDGESYRICHFYDYIHSNLAHYLSSSFITTNWTIIDSMVGSFVTDNKLYREILKTVGVLNLIENQDLAITDETISLCLTGKPDDDGVLKAIAILQSDTGKRVLFDRGTAGGLCLWPHISVDLQKAYEKANSEIGSIVNPADFIRTHLEDTNLVARRHYIQKGNLRYFSVVFCNLKDMEEAAGVGARTADGILLIPLCINYDETREAEKIAKSETLKKIKKCIVAIPGQLKILAPFIREVQIWSSVSTNTPELNGDRFGRETVSRKRAVAQQSLEEALNDVIGLDSCDGVFPLKCFWKGKDLRVKNGRDLLSRLSDACDDIFFKAPELHHELLNRRNISSAAAAARMRLIERILEKANEPLLGMDKTKKPPEMSMYMSVLQNGGLHVKDGDGYKLVLPKGNQDTLKLLPAFSFLESRLKENEGSLVKVAGLFDGLNSAPYGIRPGLSPLLLAVFYAANVRNIACYERGTFLSEVTGAEFQRLTKRPTDFEFQYCNIDGLRTVAFERLADVLKVNTTGATPDLLDVVRPLMVIISQLRPYAQKTNKLPSVAIAVRNELMDARDPMALLFEKLPVACECEPIEPDSGLNGNTEQFATTLSGAIDDLRGCYAGLQSRIKKALMDDFGFTKKREKQFRDEITARAEPLSDFVSEPKLKAFCFRLKDRMLSDVEWLDSVASMLAAKPPEKWLDHDEQGFLENMAELTSRFMRTEGVAFDKKGNYKSGSMRLCVTLPDGTEKKKVLTVSDDNKKQIAELEKQVEKLIKEYGDLALVAASKAVWSSLKV